MMPFALESFGEAIADEKIQLHRLLYNRVNSLVLILAIVRVAALFHRFDLKDEGDFCEWFVKRNQDDARGLVDQIKHWLDAAIDAGEVSESHWQFGQHIRIFRERYSEILHAI